MEGDTIIEGFNLSAMLRNFNILRSTVSAQGKLIADANKRIDQQKVHIAKLEKELAKKEDSSSAMMADFLMGFNRKK